MYPKVEIAVDKIRHNTEMLIGKCSKYNIDVAAVTKVFCAIPEVAKAMVDGGAKILADSRVENLEKLIDIDVPKLLLRLPMISQAEDVVRVADMSLNSELETIKALSKAAVKGNKKHKIILMIDLGDLREGIFEKEEIFNTVETIIDLEGIKLYGIGVNLTCYGGVIPREANLTKLMITKRELEERFGINIEVVSGGNSSSIHLLEDGTMPKGINLLRLGESLVLGRETAFGDKIKDTYEDCFKLRAEIIEIKEKPSMPIGEIGMDAFGNKPVFEDKGVRKRAICAIGRQDIDPGDVIPDDTDITILGASSDHFIIDVTDCEDEYKVGDIVSFNLTYGGILSTSTSRYIKKELV